MKLNGWKRIGIVASIVWILGAGIYTLKATGNTDEKRASEIIQSCIEGGPYTKEFDDACGRRGADYLRETGTSEWVEAASVALIPVPLGWGLTYLILFLVRWIRRGFVPLH